MIRLVLFCTSEIWKQTTHHLAKYLEAQCDLQWVCGEYGDDDDDDDGEGDDEDDEEKEDRFTFYIPHIIDD